MLRVLYLSHANFRSPRAHVHNILKTCEAMQAAGAETVLLNTDFKPAELPAILAQHNVRTPFKTVFLNVISADAQNDPNPFMRAWAICRMNWALAGYLWRNSKDFDLIYYRYHWLLDAVLFGKHVLRKPVVFESHYAFIRDRVKQAVTWLAVKTSDGVVPITQALRKYYKLSAARSLVAPCHAAESELVPREPVATLRQRLELPVEARILCYIGSLGATIQNISYEVETLVKVLPDLPQNTISLIVGARDDRDDTAKLAALAESLGVRDRVIIRPWSDRKVVMEYLAAADILILPRVGTAPGSSPSKMFDYLAASKPIVAARTPAVDEIMRDGENAAMVDADHLEQWIAAIQRIETDDNWRTQLVQGAKKTAEYYTWSGRGKRIADFLQRVYETR